ncbi:hypothetical protein N9867_00220 [bacterium]|nr:hypothetical protein [bacterium]
MLPARLVFFVGFQALFALALGGWAASAAWWPVFGAFANVATLALLVALLRGEGASFRSLLAFDGARRAGDLMRLPVVAVLAALLAYFPNVWAATWLYGSADGPLATFLGPLPFWAVVAAAAFPVTVMFAELPLYFGYAMPRLEAQTGRAWPAVVLPALFLAAQHVTLPLVLEPRFVLWRLLMFLPFALFLGVVLRRRPSMMAYVIVLHGLLDAAVLPLVWARSV